MGTLTLTRQATPSAPSSGDNVLYFKASDSLMYFHDGSSERLVFSDNAGAATQAQQEAGTSLSTYVSPGRQQFHPSACKVWCQADTNGTIVASYNMTSVTDTSAGDITFTIATDFSSNVWSAFTSVDFAGSDTAATTLIGMNHTKNAGDLRYQVRRASDGARTDPSYFQFGGFGDQL